MPHVCINIFFAIYNHRDMHDNLLIVRLLNENLPSVARNDPTVRITEQDVLRIKGRIAFERATCIDDFLRDDNLHKTRDNLRFLLEVISYPGNLFVFLSDAMAQVLEGVDDNSQLYMDGTFDICPRYFGQLYIIVMKSNTLTLPVCFALMTNRDEESYMRLWQIIVNKVPKLAKVKCWITTDFEIAAINSVRRSFPSMNIIGCYFHLKHAILHWCKANDRGLLTEDHQKLDPVLERELEILARGFHPGVLTRGLEGTIIQFHYKAQQFIYTYLPTHETFTNYMFKTWLDLSATFPPGLWSSAYRTEGSVHVDDTNNRIERYNGTVKDLIPSRTNVTIEFTVSVLQTLEWKAREQQHRLIDTGQPPGTHQILLVPTDLPRNITTRTSTTPALLISTLAPALPPPTSTPMPIITTPTTIVSAPPSAPARLPTPSSGSVELPNIATNDMEIVPQTDAQPLVPPIEHLPRIDVPEVTTTLITGETPNAKRHRQVYRARGMNKTNKNSRFGK